MTKRGVTAVVLLSSITLATYLLLPYITGTGYSGNTAATTLPANNTSKAEKIFICPMHPEIMQDHPGTCPICGMDLVESDQHTSHDHDYGIHVDSASLQKLGVRLTAVQKSIISDNIRSFGNVTVDEGTIHNVHTKYEGTIKKLHIHSVGEEVKQGQVLYEIYSPDLIMRQKEFLRFLERRNQILQTVGDVRLKENEYVMALLIELSRERSRFLYEGIDIETVKLIESSQMPIEIVKIVADQSGTITQINARDGSFIMPSDTLFSLASTRKVWVDITLYPDQAARIKQGDAVTITDSHGHRTKTKISFINPIASDNKVIARASLDNSKLRPGSFVDVDIHAEPHEALILPRSAVLRGGDGDRVMLTLGKGHFVPVYVDTGIETSEIIEITDGVLEGAKVAVNGQFLLDAAASISAAAERMTAGSHDKH
ncbi:MAG: efflux RND transporter periplasmic adaptor subunit [Gammaproteobacteria bacterium]|nr:efflux RND transporter periplasmic adaptor subunit [Gammaproteobacteria bacterium]